MKDKLKHYKVKNRRIPPHLECLCKWCGKPTLMVRIYVCRSCQEIQVQVFAQPIIAQKMLDTLEDRT